VAATRIVIQPLTAHDAEAFRSLRLRAILDTPASLWTTYEEESRASSKAVIERIRATEYQVVFGAFHDRELIGLTGLRRESLAQVSHKAMLWGVLVDSAWRGRGIARKLLETAIAHARDTKVLQIHLCVHTENVQAETLYRSFGFEENGLEPRAIRIGNRFYDERRMVLRLDDLTFGAVLAGLLDRSGTDR
jgi:RimJ/RimL family protein N-acetyltransferase